MAKVYMGIIIPIIIDIVYVFVKSKLKLIEGFLLSQHKDLKI